MNCFFSKICLALLIYSMCISCTEDLILPENDVASKIVVNGHFRPDSVWNIRITKSRTAGSQGPIETISNAIVTIFDGDVIAEQLAFNPAAFQGRGGYRGESHRPAVGRKYQLKVELDGFAPTSSCDLIPPFDTESPKISRINSDSDLGLPQLLVTFQTGDGGGKYHLVALRRSISWTFDGQDTTFLYTPWIETISIGNDDGTDLININTGVEFFELNFIEFTGVLLDDESPIASEISLTMQVGKIDVEKNTDSGKFHEFQVELRKVSDDYFMYYHSLYLQIESTENPFFSSPRIHSNISNGLGTFSAYNTNRSAVLTIGR